MTYLGCLAKPPATWTFWATRLRARRYARARERHDVEVWLSAMREEVAR